MVASSLSVCRCWPLRCASLSAVRLAVVSSPPGVTARDALEVLNAATAGACDTIYIGNDERIMRPACVVIAHMIAG